MRVVAKQHPVKEMYFKDLISGTVFRWRHIGEDRISGICLKTIGTEWVSLVTGETYFEDFDNAYDLVEKVEGAFVEGY